MDEHSLSDEKDSTIQKRSCDSHNLSSGVNRDKMLIDSKEEPLGKDDLQDSTRLMNSEVNDYLIEYTTITNAEQQRRYKSDFNGDYAEYRALHAVEEKVYLRFTELEERLEQETISSPKFKAIKKQVVREYLQNKQDLVHQKAKQRFQYLHDKLSHIKRLVLEYDQGIADDRDSPSALTHSGSCGSGQSPSSTHPGSPSPPISSSKRPGYYDGADGLPTKRPRISHYRKPSEAIYRSPVENISQGRPMTDSRDASNMNPGNSEPLVDGNSSLSPCKEEPLGKDDLHGSTSLMSSGVLNNDRIRQSDVLHNARIRQSHVLHNDRIRQNEVVNNDRNQQSDYLTEYATYIKNTEQRRRYESDFNANHGIAEDFSYQLFIFYICLFICCIALWCFQLS